MSRPQFSLKTLLWLTAVVAAFLAGAGFERWYRNTTPTIIITEAGSHFTVIHGRDKSKSK